jgi:tetratricopeptide (TPR) repeat protein
LAAALAALALVTIGGFSGMTWLWSVARTERTTAEEQLSRAIRTLDRYAGFANDPKLMSEGADPARRAALAEVRDELEALDRKYHGNPRLQQSLVLALIRVSQIEADLGEKDQAVTSCRRAIERAEAFLKGDTQSIDRRTLVLRALQRSLVIETDFGRSVVAHRRATAMLESLMRDEPDKAIWLLQNKCANDYDFAKHLLGNSRRAEAFALLRKTRDLGEALLRDQPDDTLTLRTVGRVYSYLGELENQDGESELSEKSYRRSNDLFRTVFAHGSRDLEATQEYAISCEQLQNIFGAHKKFEEATRFAQETCRVLGRSEHGDGWRDHEWFAIQRQLARAYYMLETQHGENQQVYESDSKRQAEELAAADAAGRRVHAMGESFRTLGAADAELNYYDCMCCINVYSILMSRSESSPEARDWLIRAYKVVPANLSSEDDETRRGHYQKVQEMYEAVVKKAK